MKAALSAFAVALCLVACGPKEAPPEEELDPSKEVTAGKDGGVDADLRKDVDSLPGPDEVSPGGAGDAGTAPDNAPAVSGKMVVVELTAEQREDLERQRRANRASGRRDVTVKFTAEQLEAIRKVCPECRETSITWHTDRVGVRVKLCFDDAGRILKPPDPFPYVSR